MQSSILSGCTAPVRRVYACTKTATRSRGLCLASDVMEASCRSNLAHGWHKRRLDKQLIGLDRVPHVDAVRTSVLFEVHVHDHRVGGVVPSLAA